MATTATRLARLGGVFWRCEILLFSGSGALNFLICVSGVRIAVAQQIRDLLVGAVVSAYEAFLKLDCVQVASVLGWEWARNGRFIGRDDIERQALAVPVWQ